MSGAPAGLFVTLEGGDAAGKSTQAALLEPWLHGLGRRVVRTREPGGTPLGAELRRMLLHGAHIAARAEALLYAADRAEHVASVVRPALADGAVVLQDRYLDSSVAYQGAGRVLAGDEVRGLSMWAAEGLLPHVTFLLDLDPAVGRARRAGGFEDRLEGEPDDFHARVREQYLAIAAAEPDRVIVIDAAAAPDAVQQRIRDVLAPMVGV